jgi:orotidine-5'-phosphate decarboxylase
MGTVATSDGAARRAAERIFVALDLPDLEPALGLAARLGPYGARFKVGLELFCRAGPLGVARLQDLVGPVLLDLKLHDIPRTVARAVRALAGLGVWGVTLHAMGGPVMLREAVSAARLGPSPVRVLAVTVLTSLDEALLATLGVRVPLAEQVMDLARLAQAAGCDGVVASGEEAARVRAVLGPDRLVVTPGIRPRGADRGDQRRVATAAEAVAAGADLLVVGRPVTEASDPVEAFCRLADEVAGALGAVPGVCSSQRHGER